MFFCTFPTLLLVRVKNIAIRDNKVIFNSVDAELNILNKVGKALKQPLAIKGKFSKSFVGEESANI